jgi:hypothetical protein
MFSLETPLKYIILIILLAIVLGVLLIIFKKKEGFVDGSSGPKTVVKSIDVSIIHPASIM